MWNVSGDQGLAVSGAGRLWIPVLCRFSSTVEPAWRAVLRKLDARPHKCLEGGEVGACLPSGCHPWFKSWLKSETWLLAPTFFFS